MNTDRKFLFILNLIPVLAVFASVRLVRPEYGYVGMGVFVVSLLSGCVACMLVKQSVWAEKRVQYSLGNLLLGMLGSLAFTAALSGGFDTPWVYGLCVLCGVAANVYYLRLPDAPEAEK